MNAKINQAIVAIMGEVRVLQKGDKNKHGGYNFASIDKFLEVVGGACAKHGLIILQDEIETEIIPLQNKRGEPVAWLRAKYEFQLMHGSGEIMEKTFTRSVMVPATGGQAYGSTQSYTLKQFQRSLFQVATGDKDDVDFLPPDSIDAVNMTPVARKKAGLWGEGTENPLNITSLKNKLTDLSKALASADAQDDVGAITNSDEFAPVLDQASRDLPDWYSKAEGAVQKALTELPHAEPEVSDFAVPVPLANGKADWTAWRETVAGLIEKQPADVSDIFEANKVPFGNFEKAQPRNAAALLEAFTERKE